MECALLEIFLLLVHLRRHVEIVHDVICLLVVVVMVPFQMAIPVVADVLPMVFVKVEIVWVKACVWLQQIHVKQLPVII